MGLRDLWNDFKDKQEVKAEEKRKQQIEEELIKKEALAEIAPEIREIKKKKIKEAVLAQAEKGTQSNDKTAGFKRLAEEFKGANLGTNEQMEKMLGKKSNTPSVNEKGGILPPNKISEMMGGGRLNTQRDIPGDLGRGRKFRSDYGGVIGTTPNKDYGKLVGGSSIAPEEKIQRMVGRKKKE